MILGETFVSLNRFKQDKIGTFRAPIDLLQIWLVSHLKDFGLILKIMDVSKDCHSISLFLEKEEIFPYWSLSTWFDFFKNLIPN